MCSVSSGAYTYGRHGETEQAGFDWLQSANGARTVICELECIEPRGVNFLTDISVLEIQSNSQASHLQAPESVANRPSRKGAFASLHALNVSMTAVGFACSIAVKRKPATSVSLPDQT